MSTGGVGDTQRPRPSREEQLAQLRAFLKESVDARALLEELLREDPEAQQLAGQIFYPYYEPIEPPWARYPAYVSGFATSFALRGHVAAAAAGLVRCEEGTSVVDCTLYLSLAREPYFKCLHAPSHSYDLAGQPLSPGP